MTTEKELKAQCILDIIKKMVELAEGFKYIIQENGLNKIVFDSETIYPVMDLMPKWFFPILIHRSVEGWNKKNPHILIHIDYVHDRVWFIRGKISKLEEHSFDFINYQPEKLTQLECALLHCLIEILKEV